jgi:transcriptional regulator with XRE-family HTH domain
MSKLGKRIRALRLDKNYALKDLAKVAVIQLDTLTKIENGEKVKIFDCTISKLSKALDVDEHDLHGLKKMDELERNKAPQCSNVPSFHESFDHEGFDALFAKARERIIEMTREIWIKHCLVEHFTPDDAYQLAVEFYQAVDNDFAPKDVDIQPAQQMFANNSYEASHT